MKEISLPIAQIESMDGRAQGVAHVEGKTLFVEGALPGETVEYQIVKKKSAYTVAKMLRVLKESPARVLPQCPHFDLCGGCAMQHVELSTQVAIQSRALEDALKHIGKVKPEVVFPPIYGIPWHYRHKARFSVRFIAKKNAVLVGFHEKKSSFIADMKTCRIVPPKIADLILPLRELVRALTVFDQLPQIEMAVGEDCTVLVLRILSGLTLQDKDLIQNFADMHKVVFYLQEKGPDSAFLFYPLNAPALFYSLKEFQIQMPFLPTDFTQVNHQINPILVRRAMALLNPQKEDCVADFFCGLGNFTLPIAQSGARVLGLEGKDSLIQRAQENAQKNGLKNASFQTQNLFEESFFQSFDFSRFNKILIDPPREGAVALVKNLPELSPQKILYVSCNPATLARDATVLVHCKNYALKGAGVINMFPHTAHVESIAVFEKNPR